MVSLPSNRIFQASDQSYIRVLIQLLSYSYKKNADRELRTTPLQVARGFFLERSILRLRIKFYSSEQCVSIVIFIVQSFYKV